MLQLDVTSQKVPSHMLRGLSCLSRLQHLGLNISNSDGLNLHSLSCLINLRHCSIGCSHRPAIVHTLIDAAALFTLHHLTCLELLSVQHNSSILSPLQIDACRLAIAPMGELHGLRTLAFDISNFFVDDMIFAALSQLTALTSLSVSHFSLSHATEGHLPLLQRLVIAGITPNLILQTLLPLRPLASLQRWGYDSLGVVVGSDNDAAAAVQAADLLLALQILQGTHVSLENIALELVGPRVRPWDVCHGLAPLAGSVHEIQLDGRRYHQKLGAEWAVLGACFPDLSSLHLDRCTLGNSFLGSVVSQLPHLSYLAVADCEVKAECWLGLAAVCGHPLLVIGLLDGDDDVMERCEDLQEKVFGEVHLTF